MNSIKQGWSCYLITIGLALYSFYAVANDFQYSFRDSRGVLKRVDVRRLGAENLRSIHLQKPLSPRDIQIQNEFIATASAMPTPPGLINSNRVRWFQYQTPIRNQRDRNTCSIFGITAAVEARYKRQYGLTLDLSEQYFWHVYKSTGLNHPTLYNYENQSSYWGGGNSWGVKESANYVVPLEQFAPYKDKTQMDNILLSIPAAGTLIGNENPSLDTLTQANLDAFEYSDNYIPISARQNARYGIKSYVRLGGSTVRNISKMESLIRAGNEIIIDLNLKWIMNPVTGIMEHDDTITRDAYHVMLIVGYDRDGEYFYVKNSWGGTEYLLISYDLIRREASTGSIVTEVTNPNRPNQRSRFLGVWNMDHDGWKGQLIIRRTTNKNNNATRFGHYIQSDGSRRAVNGRHNANTRGISFTIANNEFNTPGNMSGPEYYADLYSWDVNYASGYTSSNNNTWGVFLNRLGEVAPYGNNFNLNKWRGTWRMNHDGWRGTLSITGMAKANNIYVPLATYTDHLGQTKPVQGYLVPGKHHIAKLNIEFSSSNRPLFTIHYHTWDDNLFSGYSEWNGQHFGVHGWKQVD